MANDKIRKLTNNVAISGKLVELEVKEGIKEGVKWISVKGSVQFGEHKSESRRFETFQKAEKKDGGENKLYTSLSAWAKNASSEATNPENSTYVSVQSSFNDNIYIKKDGSLVEGLKINGTFFNDFEKFGASIDVEGYIQSVVEEVKNEEETGRLRVTLVTTDFFGNAVPIKNIIVGTDLAEPFMESYPQGTTTTLHVDYVLQQGESKKTESSGGLGKQRVVEGKSYLEMVLVGAKPPIEEDEEGAISPEAIKIALGERKGKVNEIKEKGYQGKSDSTSPTRKGTNKSQKPAPIEDDDDVPF